MPKGRIVEVNCQCGQELARYEKIPAEGRLIKMYMDHIIENCAIGCIVEGIKKGQTQLSLVEGSLPQGENVFCMNCEERVGTVQMIHGKPAIKLNQGQIQKKRL